jgi:hypothetical protein
MTEPDEAAPARRAAVAAHARAWDIRRVLVAAAPVLGVPGMAPTPGLFEAAALLHAAAAAQQIGCRSILWPRAAGASAPEVVEAAERAAAVAELASLGDQREALSIEVPLIDLGPRQVIELIEDAGAPLEAAWPCDHGAEPPCGRCGGCRPWADALDQLRLPWPWAPAAAPAPAG